jgi:hypothetical protein
LVDELVELVRHRREVPCDARPEHGQQSCSALPTPWWRS